MLMDFSGAMFHLVVNSLLFCLFVFFFKVTLVSLYSVNVRGTRVAEKKGHFCFGVNLRLTFILYRRLMCQVSDCKFWKNQNWGELASGCLAVQVSQWVLKRNFKKEKLTSLKGMEF